VASPPHLSEWPLKTGARIRHSPHGRLRQPPGDTLFGGRPIRFQETGGKPGARGYARAGTITAPLSAATASGIPQKMVENAIESGRVTCPGKRSGD